jgi:hypothetical protein
MKRFFYWELKADAEINFAMQFYENVRSIEVKSNMKKNIKILRN